METTVVFACFPGTDIDALVKHMNSQSNLGRLLVHVLEAPHVDEVDLVEVHLNAIGDLSRYKAPVFVSCREDILQGLESRGVDYTLIYPNRSEKEAWLGRCKDMGLDEGLLWDLEENWNTWIDACYASGTKKHTNIGADQSLTELLRVSLSN